MQPYDACRLIALNLYSFVKNPFTKDAEFGSDKFYRITYEAMRLSDDLIDLELKHIDRIIEKISKGATETSRTELELWLNIRSTAEASRRTGLGFTALGDCLAAIGYKYDSEEALLFIEQMMHIKMEAELDCTIDLAQLRGPFKGWDENIEYPDIQNSFKAGNEFYQMLESTFPVQCGRMQSYGRRNVSWNTVAPTGTVSLLTQTTSGIEPIFSLYPYIRRKKINPNDKNVRVDFVDESGDSWQEYAVIHPKLIDYMRLFNINISLDVNTKEEQEELVKITKEFLDTHTTPWDNSPSNQRRLLAEAGYNPYLGYDSNTGVAGSTGNTSQAQAAAPLSVNPEVYSNLGSQLGRAAQMVYEESQSNAMTQNLQSQKDVNSAQAMQLLSNIDWGKTTPEYCRWMRETGLQHDDDEC